MEREGAAVARDGKLFHWQAAATAKKEGLPGSSATVNTTSSSMYFNCTSVGIINIHVDGMDTASVCAWTTIRSANHTGLNNSQNNIFCFDQKNSVGCQQWYFKVIIKDRATYMTMISDPWHSEPSQCIPCARPYQSLRNSRHQILQYQVNSWQYSTCLLYTSPSPRD